MLEIKDIAINYPRFLKKERIETYPVNITLNDKFKLGVYSRLLDVTSIVLKQIAGINPSNVRFNGSKGYNSSRYFKNRIYLDLKKVYFSTINSKEISKYVDYTCAKKFNDLLFDEMVNQLNVRSHAKVKDEIIYDEIASTYINLAFALSIDGPLAIINNYGTNIKNTKDLDYINDNLIKSEKSFVLGLNVLSIENLKLDYLLIIDDYKKVRVYKNNEILYLVDNEALSKTLILDNDNKMFLSKDQKRIVYSSISKDEERLLKARNISFIKIKLTEVESYL